MEDETKSRHETMNKILKWGTVVYFLVMGFALNQHALFELYTPAEELQLEKAKSEHANLMQSESDRVAAAGNLLEAAKLKVDAAQARLDVRLLQEEKRDGWTRAVGLLTTVSAYCIFYPLAVLFFYKKRVYEDTGYFIPLSVAVAYGVIMSVLTFLAALFTSIQ